jgi:hypothetical protein
VKRYEEIKHRASLALTLMAFEHLSTTTARVSDPATVDKLMCPHRTSHFSDQCLRKFSEGARPTARAVIITSMKLVDFGRVELGEICHLRVRKAICVCSGIAMNGSTSFMQISRGGNERRAMLYPTHQSVIVCYWHSDEPSSWSGCSSAAAGLPN